MVGAGVAALVSLGRARQRRKAIAFVLIAATLAAVPAYYGFKSYLLVSREEAVSESQATAAYRRELLDTYVSVVEQRPTWGYGRDFPRDGSMNSIDNYYLLLALTHGVYALAAFRDTPFMDVDPACADGRAFAARGSVGFTGFDSARGLPGVRCFDRYGLPWITGCSAPIDGDRMERRDASRAGLIGGKSRCRPLRGVLASSG